MPSQLKRIKRTTTTPGEAEETIQSRMRKLRMTWPQYIASLVSYDCWAERDHLLTGEACRGTREDEERLWKEIIRDFGLPDKTGGFFEHRVEEFVLKRRLPGNE